MTTERQRLPNIRALKPNDLAVDEETQRKYDPAHAKRIADNFDVTLVGLLQVSRRADGTFYVIDGQHRRAAAIIAGHGHRPLACQVMDGLTLEEEARRFVGVNSTTKKPSALDLYRLRVKSGDETAVAINTIVNSHGLHAGTGAGDGQVQAVVALEKVFTEHGPLVLSRTLDVLLGAWQRDRDAYDASVLRGLASVLASHPDLDEGRMVKVLAKSGSPARLIGKARSLAEVLRTNRPAAMHRAIVETYNSKLHNGRLEDQ